MHQQFDSRSLGMHRQAANSLWQSVRSKWHVATAAGSSSRPLRSCQAALAQASSSRGCSAMQGHCRGSPWGSSFPVRQRASTVQLQRALPCVIGAPASVHSSGSGSSSWKGLHSSPAIAAAAGQQPGTPSQDSPSPLTTEQQAAVNQYLAELSDEQQRAAFSTEQHVRVIAGEFCTAAVRHTL